MKTILFSLLFLFTLSVVTSEIYAQQIPGEDEFTDFGPVGTANELDETWDKMVMIMDGLDSSDVELNKVFDGIPITQMYIGNEKTGLHIGITDELEDEEYYDLLSNLKTVFPDITYTVTRDGYFTFAQSSTTVITKTTSPNLPIPDNGRQQNAISTSHDTIITTSCSDIIITI